MALRLAAWGGGFEGQAGASMWICTPVTTRSQGTSSLLSQQIRPGTGSGWVGVGLAASSEENQEPVLSSGARTQLVHTSCEFLLPWA